MCVLVCDNTHVSLYYFVQSFHNVFEKEAIHAIEHRYNGPGAPCVLKVQQVSWTDLWCYGVHVLTVNVLFVGGVHRGEGGAGCQGALHVGYP